MFFSFFLSGGGRRRDPLLEKKKRPPPKTGGPFFFEGFLAPFFGGRPFCVTNVFFSLAFIPRLFWGGKTVLLPPLEGEEKTPSPPRPDRPGRQGFQVAGGRGKEPPHSANPPFPPRRWADLFNASGPRQVFPDGKRGQWAQTQIMWS
eukprot:FR743870.1.p2 GENE.FR743870.1~~FR743870.1.p2  ORF type:complete len:147 (-),score=64.77 FR743870.1:846-1286(-)